MSDDQSTTDDLYKWLDDIHANHKLAWECVPYAKTLIEELWKHNPGIRVGDLNLDTTDDNHILLWWGSSDNAQVEIEIYQNGFEWYFFSRKGKSSVGCNGERLTEFPQQLIDIVRGQTLES